MFICVFFSCHTEEKIASVMPIPQSPGKKSCDMEVVKQCKDRDTFRAVSVIYRSKYKVLKQDNSIARWQRINQ